MLAMRFYNVEEMLAALVLLAVLIRCTAVVVLLLFMLGRAGEALIAFTELCGRKLMHHAYWWRAASDPRPKTKA